MRLSLRLFRIFGVLLLLCCSLGVAAYAQAVAESHAQVQLIAEESAYQPGRPLWVGVLFHLDGGWHVYWQNPGDSGTPPKIQWAVPQGFHAGATHWPRPMRMGKGSVIDYGYENQLLLMAPVMAPANATGPATIAAEVKYVVCREICIPGKAQLSLPVARSTDRVEHFSDSHQLFQSTREQFPSLTDRVEDFGAIEQEQLRAYGSRRHLAEKCDVLPARPCGDRQLRSAGAVCHGWRLRVGAGKIGIADQACVSLRGVLDVPGTGAFELAVPIVQ